MTGHLYLHRDVVSEDCCLTTLMDTCVVITYTYIMCKSQQKFTIVFTKRFIRRISPVMVPQSSYGYSCNVVITKIYVQLYAYVCRKSL